MALLANWNCPHRVKSTEKRMAWDTHWPGSRTSSSQTKKGVVGCLVFCFLSCLGSRRAYQIAEFTMRVSRDRDKKQLLSSVWEL